jgi:hypothetical protein
VLLRQEGITETRLDSPSDRFPEVHEKSLVFLGPIIFCSAALLSQNPAIVSLALGVISNYLTEFFRGLPGDHTVRLDIVTEEGEGDNHRYKRYHFEGPTDSLPEFTKMTQEAQRHD